MDKEKRQRQTREEREKRKVEVGRSGERGGWTKEQAAREEREKRTVEVGRSGERGGWTKEQAAHQFDSRQGNHDFIFCVQLLLGQIVLQPSCNSMVHGLRHVCVCVHA